MKNTLLISQGAQVHGPITLDEAMSVMYPTVMDCMANLYAVDEDPQMPYDYWHKHLSYAYEEYIGSEEARIFTALLHMDNTLFIVIDTLPNSVNISSVCNRLETTLH